MSMTFEPIAIIGYGCVFPPDSYNIDSFWENILSGKLGVDVMPEEYWKKDLYFDKDRHEEDKTYCKFGAYVKNYKFNNSLNINIDKIKGLNKSQLMLLDTIIQSLQKGGKNIDSLCGNNVSMVVANMLGDYSFSNNCLLGREEQIEYYLENNSDFKNLSQEEKNSIKNNLRKSMSKKFINDDLADRNKIFHSNLCKGVADIIGISGKKFIVDGACSGSLLAVDNGVKIIHTKRARTCVVSGVLGNMGVTGNIAFAKIGGLSETGSFPMDSKANGLIPGEGVGTIIIKSLSDAIEDNDKIFGVIRGTGVASDGKGKSIYAPSSSGQFKAMKKSIDKAGVTADYIDYIETHATGTRVGDIVELNTIKMLFDKTSLDNKKIAIGSIKSQIGHCFSAAGMANLIKVLEGFNRKLMPPTNHFEKFADEAGIDSNKFYVNKELKPWNKEGAIPRTASLNAFGFGGINANVLVEEYEEKYHENLLNQYENKCNLDNFDFSIVGIGCLDNNGEGFEKWIENTKTGYKYENKYPADRYPNEINEIYNSENKLKASFIENFKFPCIKFKIPPMILKEIDRAQQLGLMACEQVISQYGKEKINGERTGVYIGNMLGLETSINTDLRIRIREYIDALKGIEEFNKLSDEIKNNIINDMIQGVRKYIHETAEDTLPGYMDNIVAGRIANYFDISGPNAIYDSDNISFEEALDQGLMSLQLKENDCVLVGGVNGNMSPEFINMLDKIGVNSDNNISSEGAAVFLIKRSEDVAEDEHVYAKITNLKFKNSQGKDYSSSKKISNSDGSSMFYYGAQGAFLLLEACAQICSNEEDYVSINSTSMLDGAYLINVQNPDVEIPSEIDESYKVLKIAANSIEELIAKAKNNENVSEDEFRNSKYRVAFSYDDEKELNIKLRSLQKLLSV